jgi:hypothetical protein
VFGSIHPATLFLVLLPVGYFCLSLFVGRGERELRVGSKSVSWGVSGRARPAEEYFLSALASAAFLRRADGTGAVELLLGNGKRVFVPDEFTDGAGVADALLQALRERLPELRIEVR